MENKKNKHLTLEDRLEIQQCLDHGMTFKAIAGRIGKDQTTVSKEVKKHLEFTASKVIHRDKNGNTLPPPVCPKLLKTPFVCNPCEKKRYSCPYQKQKYVAKSAQKEYEALLVEAREGIPLNKEEFYAADTVITDGIKGGQHLYHILQSNDLKMSKSSVYRHLHKGYLSVSAIDFPRVVKFKPRRQTQNEYIPKAAKIGRAYADFLVYDEEMCKMEQTKYSSEFKADALRVAETEGVKAASEKLGVRSRQIYDWRRTERLRQNKAAKKLYPGESLQEANKRLEKENDELREANHILKKAMGFFVGR